MGEQYSYTTFLHKLRLKKLDMSPAQLGPLEQRMGLLESFISKTKGQAVPSRFAPGQLTIIDLSDPFIDPGQACNLFEILVRLFVRAKIDTGKVLVVDEAHKVRFFVSSRNRNISLLMITSIWGSMTGSLR